jgi:hypothetical protein
MADAAGIAAITAGSTLIASGISGTLSYLAAKRSTSVQLAAIESEMERLKVTHEEEERRERKGLYVEFLTIVNRNTAALDGSSPLDKALYEKHAEEFGLAYARMLLFATERVIEEMGGISTGFDQVGNAVMQGKDEPESFADRARTAFRPHKAQIFRAEGRLIAAMKHELKGHRLLEEFSENTARGSPSEET